MITYKGIIGETQLEYISFEVFELFIFRYDSKLAVES